MRGPIPLRLLRAQPARLALVTLAGLALLAGGAAADEAGGPHVVRDPYFGTTLFDFYQQRYFSALTGLMASQYFARLPHHAEEAELLRGGLYLSYGLHREAAEIFTRLINQGAAPSVRDRAWYYLAKIRYQRGLLPEAEDALGRVKGLLPGDLEVDRNLMLGNLLMARGDYAQAARILEPVAERSRPSLYARYNLGVALIKGGSAERGAQMLDEIGLMTARTDEQRSLRDKANVALGYAALQAQQPERARAYLERVRLDGMLANKALLGFGWAADSLHQPKEALVPWLELLHRDPSDPAVLEAHLAVPYALAQLEAYGQSLDAYHDAIAAYESESRNLDESIAAIRSGELLDGLLASNPGEEMGWFWSIDRLPRIPHAAHLAPILATHEFQESFKNYRDLEFLGRNLHEWQESLDVIGDMLENRQRAFAERLPGVRARQRTVGIDALERQRDALGAELDAAARAGDGTAFASAKERELEARLARDRAILDHDAANPSVAELAERYRRVAGALAWQLAQELPDRMWAARKDMQQLSRGLREARAHDAELAKAQQTEPARFDAFAARIAELRRRLVALQPRVAELAGLQRAAVEDLVVAGLQEQKDRLVEYTNQARFAVAQIYDRAGRAKESPNAPPP